MADVFDVAEYILRNKGRMMAMKLKKLVYYSQAWSLGSVGELIRQGLEEGVDVPVAPVFR